MSWVRKHPYQPYDVVTVSLLDSKSSEADNKTSRSEMTRLGGTHKAKWPIVSEHLHLLSIRHCVPNIHEYLII